MSQNIPFHTTNVTSHVMMVWVVGIDVWGGGGGDGRSGMEGDFKIACLITSNEETFLLGSTCPTWFECEGRKKCQCKQ